MSDAEQAALLKAVCDAPDDDAPRLAYAAWCDQRSDPRGEFIRLQIEAAKSDQSTSITSKRDRDVRIDRLLSENKKSWLSDLAEFDVFDPTISPEFFRGFVSCVRIPAEAFLASRERLFQKTPIQHLLIRGGHRLARQILLFPRLIQVEALSLSKCGMTDADAEFLADCPFLANTWWLNLSGNLIDEAGINALIDSPFMKRLSYVNLEGNRVNPTDAVDEWGNITSKHPIQAKLEKKMGPVPWFHPTTNNLWPVRARPLRSEVTN